mmetsp:Transcript_9649/g.13102  ORF Transcript_9649/g.13102 Transcript_9649/m.13102 type:complete len:255 (+) Transcript_9649:213-977(+)|eukprot:CAMPEP_0196571490 /NCGR_PEP_ID=MMETSP1081-20130531/1657_1 /TAXON_ID=36882 /ORGANISM="Pyramimonas amylifera, Strain CCMP720" /LENGTH=254 /DNA_ID=CAMNT_0041888459 /DNA_START=214 /DNA_END=978 /DNA_ORIENTATION=+
MVNPEAIRVAKLAVEADNAKNFAEAARLYVAAADLILADDPSEQDRAVAIAYKNQAATLKQRLVAQQMADMQATSAVAQQGVQVVSTVNKGVSSAGGMSTMAATAAVGGAVGFLVAGPMLAMAGAGAAAYAATRSDSVGDAARSTGQGAVKGFERAKQLDQEHHITEKARSAASAGIEKAKEMNTKYNILGSLSNAFNSGVEKAKEIEAKHNVSSRVGGAMSSGLDSVTKALGSTGNTAPTNSSTTNTLPSVPK